MVLALHFVYHTGAQGDKHFINHSWTYKGLLLRCVLFHGLCFCQIFKYLFGLLSNPFFFKLPYKRCVYFILDWEFSVA